MSEAGEGHFAHTSQIQQILDAPHESVEKEEDTGQIDPPLKTEDAATSSNYVENAPQSGKEEEKEKSNPKYVIGEVGGELLKAWLSHDAPRLVISRVQQEFGLRIDQEFQSKIVPTAAETTTFEPIMPLCDLLGISRLEVHKMLLEKLTKKLLQQLDGVTGGTDTHSSSITSLSSSSSLSSSNYSSAKKQKITAAQPIATTQGTASLSSQQLQLLLSESFPYVSFPELRPVTFSLLTKINHIPRAFLRQLAANADLYDSCPIEVRRQIWLDDEKTFKMEMNQLIERYAKCPYRALSCSDISGQCRTSRSEFGSGVANPSSMGYTTARDLHVPKNRRANDEIINTIIHSIGKSLQLYNSVLRMLRSKYVATGNVAYCTLRSSVLMGLHDNGVVEIYDRDPCHNFAWCLDACVADNTFDDRRIAEIQSCLNPIDIGDPVVGDLSMIVRDYYLTHSLLSTVIVRLQEIVKRQGIPKEDNKLKYCTLLLSMGFKAREMIAAKKFELPKEAKYYMHTLYPKLATRMIDDELHRKGLVKVDRSIEPALMEMIQKHELTRAVMLCYLASQIEIGDCTSVTPLLTLLNPLQEYANSLSHSTSNTDKAGLAGASSSTLSCDAELRLAISSLLSRSVTTDIAMRALVLDKIVVPYVRYFPLLHVQFIHFLSSVHARLSVEDLVSYINSAIGEGNVDEEGKYLDSINIDNIAAEERTVLNDAYNVFVDRVMERLERKNSNFIINFINKLGCNTSKEEKKAEGKVGEKEKGSGKEKETETEIESIGEFGHEQRGAVSLANSPPLSPESTPVSIGQSPESMQSGSPPQSPPRSPPPLYYSSYSSNSEYEAPFYPPSFSYDAAYNPDVSYSDSADQPSDTDALPPSYGDEYSKQDPESHGANPDYRDNEYFKRERELEEDEQAFDDRDTKREKTE